MLEACEAEYKKKNPTWKQVLLLHDRWACCNPTLCPNLFCVIEPCGLRLVRGLVWPYDLVMILWRGIASGSATRIDSRHWSTLSRFMFITGERIAAL